MEGDEMEMTREEFQRWISEQIKESDLVSQDLLKKCHLLQTLLEKKEKQAASILKLCESVAKYEAIVKKQYSMLGWEYRETDSEEDEDITDNGNAPKLSCDNLNEDQSKKQTHYLKPVVVLMRLPEHKIRALSGPSLEHKKSEDELSSISCDSDGVWEPEEQDLNDSDFSECSVPEDFVLCYSPSSSEKGGKKRKKSGQMNGKGTKTDAAASPTPSARSSTPSPRTPTPPTRSSTPPTRSSTPPTRSSTPPTRSSTPPTRSSTPLTRSSTPPTRSSTPAEKSTTLAAKSTMPAAKSTTPAAKSTTPAAKSSTLAAKSSTPAAKSITPAAKSTTPAAKSTPFAAKSSMPAAKSSMPAAKSSTLPTTSSMQAAKSTTPATETSTQNASSKPNILYGRKILNVPSGTKSTESTQSHDRPSKAPAVLPEVTEGMTVLARKKAMRWYRGKVSEIIKKENGTVKYKVVFENDLGKVLVSGHHIAFDLMHKLEQLPELARVLVRHPDETWFCPGVLAERPGRKNRMRFLVFLDDHTPIYVSLPLIRLVCKPLQNPWDDIPEGMHKNFIEQHTKWMPNPPLTQCIAGQTMRVMVNEDLQKCSVVQVDFNLIEVLFLEDQRKEWIYRGSPRLEHIINMTKYLQSNESKTDEKKNAPLLKNPAH